MLMLGVGASVVMWGRVFRRLAVRSEFVITRMWFVLGAWEWIVFLTR
jgi:hypothetical protein